MTEKNISDKERYPHLLVKLQQAMELAFIEALEVQAIETDDVLSFFSDKSEDLINEFVEVYPQLLRFNEEQELINFHSFTTI